jgi:hypothetical protein
MRKKSWIRSRQNGRRVTVFTVRLPEAKANLKLYFGTLFLSALL